MVGRGIDANENLRARLRQFLDRTQDQQQTFLKHLEAQTPADKEKAIGWPTNSGRCSINIFRPKNPRLITAQLTTAAAIGANKGDADRSDVDERGALLFSFIRIKALTLAVSPHVIKATEGM